MKTIINYVNITKILQWIIKIRKMIKILLFVYIVPDFLTNGDNATVKPN